MFFDPTSDYDPENWYYGDNFYCGPCLNKEDADGKNCCNRLDFNKRGDLKGDCIPCECDSKYIKINKGKQWWRLS